MKKTKLISVIVSLALLAGCIAAFAGCADKAPDKKIVYLGDSIAEAIAGPEPISERERYGYYGVIGMINNYEFINRSVSGHTTSDLLNVIKREDKETGARLTRTHIKTADIIHISILGNDFLNSDLGGMALAAAKEDFTEIDRITENAAKNIADSIALLKELNPNAVLMFQNVYNPIFEGSSLLNQNPEALAELGEMGCDIWDIRALGDIILSRLNGVLDSYLDANPGSIHIVDAFGGFEEIFKQSPQTAAGFIASDSIHPSSSGHAALTGLTQAKLEELGLADGQYSLKKYKELRTEQLERLYGEKQSVSAVKKQIRSAEDVSGVSKAYFEAIKGMTMTLNAKTYNKKQTHLDSDTVFNISLQESSLMGNTASLMLSDKSLVKLTKKGRVLVSVRLNALLITAANSMVKGADFNEMLGVAGVMFPGLSADDIAGSLSLIDNIMGLTLNGFDFTLPKFAGLAESLKNTGRFPDDFTLPDNFGLNYSRDYTAKTFNEGTSDEVTAIYAGDKDYRGESFSLMTLSKTEDGRQRLEYSIEILQIKLVFYK